MASPPSPATRSDERDGLAAAVERSASRATRHARTLWCVALLALVADVALTAYGLRNGYVETNPLAVAMFRRVGVPATFAALKGFPLAVAGVGRAVLPPEFRGVVPFCLAVPWTAAAVVNVLVLAGVFG